MKHLITLAAGGVVAGGLIAASVAVHNHQHPVAVSPTVPAAQLQVVRMVDAKNIQLARAEAAADRQVLCAFIASHLKPTLLPTECK